MFLVEYISWGRKLKNTKIVYADYEIGEFIWEFFDPLIVTFWGFPLEDKLLSAETEVYNRSSTFKQYWLSSESIPFEIEFEF